MIGFVRDLLIEHVIAPQAAAERGERRAHHDPDSTPLGVEAQEIDLLALTTVPTGFEIGGTIELRHTISAALDVQHGDRAEAGRLRDAIVLDLCLRALDARSLIEGEYDPASGQTIEALSFTIDYRPLGTSDTNESAVIVFTADTRLER